MPVPNLHQRLKELNALVDPAHVKASERLFEDAFMYREVERLPAISYAPVEGWETYPYAEVFEDPEKMLINELANVYVGAKLRDDRMYAIRANYGVGIMASLFGCHTFLTMNNMPWCEALPEDKLMEALDRGVPDITAGLGGRVLDTIEFYKETLAPYPNLREAVRIYICDTQGPFDTTHLIMGHRIYTEIYDNPELVHRLLDLVTKTYINFTRAQKEITGEGDEWSYHGTQKVRGGIRICEDAPTNISAASYREFCKPYNERLLKEFKGGWIHYCGDGYQIFPEVITTPGLTGINFGNPERQDLRAVYREAAPRGIGVINWGGAFTESDQAAIRTGISIIN